MPKVRNEKKVAESTEAAKAVPIKEQSAKIKKGIPRVKAGCHTFFR